MKTKEEIKEWIRTHKTDVHISEIFAFLEGAGINVLEVVEWSDINAKEATYFDFKEWFNEEPKEDIDKTEKELCEQYFNELTVIIDAMDKALNLESKVFNAKPMFKSEAQIKVDETEKLIDNSKPIQFRLLANSISDLYEEKNKAYGDSFGKSVKKYGLVSALTRMSDKWNRLENLILNNERENDESLEDTLKDLASYCLMTVMELGSETKKE